MAASGHRACRFIVVTGLGGSVLASVGGSFFASAEVRGNASARSVNSTLRFVFNSASVRGREVLMLQAMQSRGGVAHFFRL